MSSFCTILLLFNSYILVNSVIPVLKVRKIDNKLIERKRLDTLEICRLFNEENVRLKVINSVNNKVNDGNITKSRIKRDAKYQSNPTRDNEDIEKVENIIDKLYDDIETNGTRVTYRQRNLKEITKNQPKQQKLNRRFNFAPANLSGPSTREKEEKTIDSKSSVVKIPWIKKWKYGIVPFYIDLNTYDSHLSKIIINAFDYIEKATCIRLQRLRERPTDKESLQKVEWLYITNPSGIRQCVHSNEKLRNTGVQMVVLGYNCLSQGEIVHEIMHILGFSHEHTRPDRDSYVTIEWENIKPGYKKYFELRKKDVLMSLPYDYASVLHYPPRAFSKNGQVTVVAESGVKIGQREALSEIDVQKVGMIYGLECVERNKDYLQKTCPSVVVVSNRLEEKVKKEDIDKYFNEKIWPYGIVNYKIKDKLEFTAEEIENIKAVLSHIEAETCIEFRDISKDIEVEEAENKDEDSEEIEKKPNKGENSSIETSKSEPDDWTVQPDTETLPTFEFENFTKLSEITAADKIVTLNFSRYSDNEVGKVEERVLRSKGKLTTNLSKKEKYIKYAAERNLKRNKRSKRATPISPLRRHAANVMVLVRSTEPGCKCPSSKRPDGDQVISINGDCFNSVNDLLHLFVHILGLDHQHNMHDRDAFLHILWDKLTPEVKKDMEKKLPPAASAGFAYDYQSVMHYPWLQIKDGVTNIIYPIWNDGWVMGHWQGLSTIDVEKLNLIYSEECEKRRNHTTY